MIKQLEKFEIEEVMDIWLKTNITAHSFIPKEYWIKNYNIVKEEYFLFPKLLFTKKTI